MRARLSCLVSLLLLSAACSAPEDAPAASESDLQKASAIDAVPGVGRLRLTQRMGLGGDSYYFCTGTLVAPNVVLTARHCVGDIGVDGMQGSFAVKVPSGRDYPMGVREFTISRALVPGSANTDDGKPMGLAGYGQDVGLVVLDEPVPADVAKPIPLRASALAQGDVGRAMFAVGFSRDGYALEHVGGPMTLRAVKGQAMHQAFGTRAAYESYLADYFERMMRDNWVDKEKSKQAMLDFYDMELSEPSFEVWAGAAKGDSQTCFGDSGGPLLDKVGGEYQLVGVVSSGSPMIGPYECVLGGSFIAVSAELRRAVAHAAADPEHLGWCEKQDAARKWDDGWFCDGNVRVTCWSKNFTRVSYADDCAQRGKVCKPTGGAGKLGPASCAEP